MPDKAGLGDAFGLAADQKFLRRHVLDLDPAAWHHPLAGHVKQQLGRLLLDLRQLLLQLLHRLLGLRVALLRRLQRWLELLSQLLDGLLALLVVVLVRVAFLLGDLDLFVVQQLRQFDIGQGHILLAGLFAAGVPPDLDDAVLGQQRVFHPGVSHALAVVAGKKQVVAVVGSLLGLGLVAGLVGLKLHHAVAAAELDHQLRQHALDGVAHVRADHTGAALHLGRRQVQLGLAQVVGHGLQALVGQLAAPIADSLAHLAVGHGAQLVIGHFGHGQAKLSLG